MAETLYTAAHSGFPLERVPMGGAAAVCAHLTAEWGKTQPFPFQILGPSLLGPQAPHDKDLVEYSELRYARFCFTFEKILTREILRHSPRETIVLSNDISEGPDFRRLSDAGYRIFTFFHVDVVDYFTRMYLRGWIRPETATRAYEALSRLHLDGTVPKLLNLVFKKQRDCVRGSRGLIVPAQEMKDVLLTCYPETPAKKIHVVPWGLSPETFDESAVEDRRTALEKKYGIPKERPVLVLLSRISPEKGQDRLLKAVRLWESQADFPAAGLTVIIAGEAAYMHGRGWLRRLRNLAGRLRRTQVLFPGHLSGIEKEAHLRLGWLYVFPSRHESYGLTLLEAMRAGLPALACRHYSSDETLRPDFGEIVSCTSDREAAALLLKSLKHLLADHARLRAMGEKARRFAEERCFSDTARRVAEILQS